jgi:spore germination protein PE
LNSRISLIEQLRIHTSNDTTIIEIGDSAEITPLAFSIAVQRERAVFYANEFNFDDYSIFSRKLLQPVITENITKIRMNDSPVIRVRKIDISTVASCGVVHLGSSRLLKAESRIKHIRHLLRERP